MVLCFNCINFVSFLSRSIALGRMEYKTVECQHQIKNNQHQEEMSSIHSNAKMGHIDFHIKTESFASVYTNNDIKVEPEFIGAIHVTELEHNVKKEEMPVPDEGNLTSEAVNSPCNCNVQSHDVLENYETNDSDVSHRIKKEVPFSDNHNLEVKNEYTTETSIPNGTAYDQSKHDISDCRNTGLNTHTMSSSLYKSKCVSVDGESFSCLNCDKGFIHKSSLYRHTRVCVKGETFICLKCDKSFSTKSSLCMHERICVEGETFNCHKCDKSFSHKCSLNRHKRVCVKGETYSCLKCDKTFSDQSNLNRHKLICLKGETLSCLKCGKISNSKSSYYRHKHSCVKGDTF